MLREVGGGVDDAGVLYVGVANTIRRYAPNGGGFAKAAINASEQIRAATGVDLAAVARRLEASATKP